MRRPRSFNSEDNMHLQICQYLRLQYPDVLFRSDMAGVNLASPVARANHIRLQSGRAWPDLFIAQPKEGHYHGLFLELKKEGTKLLKKNGEMVANEHFREQQAICDKLYALGYFARIVVGFDEAKRYIDWYIRDSDDFLKEYGERSTGIWTTKSVKRSSAHEF